MMDKHGSIHRISANDILAIPDHETIAIHEVWSLIGLLALALHARGIVTFCFEAWAWFLQSKAMLHEQSCCHKYS